MKKTSLMLLVAALLALASCAKQVNEPTDSKEAMGTSASEPTQTATIAPIETQAPVVPSETPTVLGSDSTTNPTTDLYADLIEKYSEVVIARAQIPTLIEKGMSEVIAECYGENGVDNIGYAIIDIDGDGTNELLIAATENLSDDFYGKLVFDMYTLDDSGNPIKVLTSSNRNRYYYAGENRFANIGSGGADYSFDTVCKLQDRELVDMTQSIPQSEYVQLELNRFGE